MPVDSRDLTEMFGALKILFTDAAVEQIIQEAADTMGIEGLEHLLDTYPPPPPDGTEPSPLKTPKQKRWWWWSMNRIANGQPVSEGLRGYKVIRKKVSGRQTLVISGSYRRTGTMIRSINYDVASSARGVIVSFGPTMAREATETSSASYASFVIGEQQAPIHAGRWEKLNDAVEKMAPDLLDKFEESLVEQIRKRMKGHGDGLTGQAVR